MSRTLDELLAQAAASAEAGDWQAAFQMLIQADALAPDEPGLATGLGTCLLQLGQYVDALPYFQRAVERQPTSAEAHNNLGFVYTLVQNPEQAERAYRSALQYDPGHLVAQKNLAQLYLDTDRPQHGVPLLAEIVRRHPRDAQALAMMAGCYEEAGDFESARTLYAEALRAEPDFALAREALARLPSPAAERIARPEHAPRLIALKRKPPSPTSRPRSAALPLQSVFFCGTGEVSAGVRLEVPAQALSAAGWRVRVGQVPGADDLAEHETFVFSRPHLAPEFLESLQTCVRAGKRVIVDLDDDFHRLPPDHPGYAYVGPGNPERLRLLESALAQAESLVVATPALAERYGLMARRVVVIPNGWNSTNRLWARSAKRLAPFVIGWAGTATHRADVAVMKPGVTRFLRENPQALLVIAGDPAIYESFGDLPEAQRLYLPYVPFDDYPYVLAHFDVLLAPLRDDAFNRAKSDIKLVEAGARGIPWVASPLPAYLDWEIGGLLAEKPEDWHAALTQLASDTDLRYRLGALGCTKAETRTEAQIGAAWARLLSDQHH